MSINPILAFQEATIIDQSDDRREIYESDRDLFSFQGSYEEWVAKYNVAEFAAVFRKPQESGVGGGLVNGAGITRSMMEQFDLKAGEKVSGIFDMVGQTAVVRNIMPKDYKPGF